MKIRGDPSGPGRIFLTFSEMVPPGPWDDYLGPWGALGPLFGGAWALYMGVGPCKLISVACIEGIWLEYLTLGPIDQVQDNTPIVMRSI